MTENTRLKKGESGRRKPRRYNLHIPSVFAVFGEGEEKENGRSDLPENFLFVPTEDRIQSPIALNTSKMALQWARGKL